MTCHCKSCRRDKLEAEFTDDKGKQFKTCNACREKKRKPKGERKRRTKVTLEVCQALAQEKGGVCLSDEYKNNSTKMKWRCAEGHEFMMRYNHTQRGHWCPTCKGIKIGNMSRLTIDVCHKAATDCGGECLSDVYLNGKTKMKWRCAEGHEWMAAYEKIKQGRWCPTCAGGRSENIVRETLEAKTEEKWPKQRPKWLDGLELDGYCKELNTAFEYQGRQHYEYVPFFHNNDPANLAKQQERDRKKYEVCVKRGIKLMLIPYKFNCYDEDKLKTYVLDQLAALGV